jgi:hypothetical protein
MTPFPVFLECLCSLPPVQFILPVRFERCWQTHSYVVGWEKGVKGEW